MWYYLSGDSFPLLTIIGSGNFGTREIQSLSCLSILNIGQRSLVRDLECQVVVVTQNYSLQESLHKVTIMLTHQYTLVHGTGMCQAVRVWKGIVL